MHHRYQYVVLFCFVFRPWVVCQKPLYLFLQRTQYPFVTCADGYKLMASSYQIIVDGGWLLNISIPTIGFGRLAPLTLRLSTTNSSPSASQLSELEDGVANLRNYFPRKMMYLYLARCSQFNLQTRTLGNFTYIVMADGTVELCPLTNV